jgi:hypothetical protein
MCQKTFDILLRGGSGFKYSCNGKTKKKCRHCECFTWFGFHPIPAVASLLRDEGSESYGPECSGESCNHGDRSGKLEFRPGLSNALKIMSRVAPQFALLISKTNPHNHP